MTRPTALFALIGALALPLGLAGCGGGAEETAETPAAAGGPVETTTSAGGNANTTTYPDGSRTQSTVTPEGGTQTTVTGPLSGQAEAVETGDAMAAPTTSAPANP